MPDRLIGTLEIGQKLGGKGNQCHKVFTRRLPELLAAGFPKPHPAFPDRRLWSERLVDRWLALQPGQQFGAVPSDDELDEETALLQARLAAE